MDRNKELLNTKQAAECLGVSVSTVRRWCDNGVLPCYRVGEAGYRKFEPSEVEKLKNKFYGASAENDDLKSGTANEKTIITKNISAEAHPAHYLMHKYWGRKAHNIVKEYITCFTDEGDTILEPFMGSGVTVIEALKLKRKVIGLDINPMSKFIVENTISKVDLNLFSHEYQRILTSLKRKYGNLYNTFCPFCNAISTIETAVWENDEIVRIKGNCPTHGNFVCDASSKDVELYNQCSTLKNDLLKKQEISYPTDDIMQYVKRSGRNRIDELFSDRALIILSELRKLIFAVDNTEVRNLLLFCFTSMLSNVSRMLPGDKERSTYKSGWVISKFWTPKIHTERNIFHCLSLRYKAILKGKEELEGIDASLATLLTSDASSINFIPDNSIDYIFTDPPYGESIAYLALSQFWNSWLPTKVNYEQEIIIDPYREKGYEDYAQRTKMAYREFYRVLKNNHYMSFTFHNRDLIVWKAILDACSEAGFILENIILQEQAVSSGTQGINRKNTLTGDFIYNFKKDLSQRPQNSGCEKKDINFVKETIEKFILEHDGATPSELYEYLIPIIVQNNAYTDEEGNAINIEKLLKESYDYIKVSVSENSKVGGAYKWIKKSN